MLPILRLIPVGGVLLAIAILLLALNPPQATSRSTRASLLPARGALIDRAEHPEWRQFLIQAALRRAGEVERLRNLRDTVVRGEPPVAMMPAPAWVKAKPDVVEAAPVEAGPEITEAEPMESKTVEAEPKVAAPIDTKPETAEPKVADLTPIIDAEPKPAKPETVAREPEPVAAEPEITDAAPAEPTPEAAELKVADLTPIIDLEPTAAEPKPAVSNSETVAGKPESIATEPEIADASPAEPNPEATELKVADLTPIIDVEPKATEPASAASEPEPIAGEPEIADAAPAEPKLEAEELKVSDLSLIINAESKAAEPKIADAAPTLPLETDGSRIRPDVAPPATPSPAETRIAALPTPPTENAGDDITGSIEPADRTATIPVGIGAASSTELEVTLPRERPPALRTLDLRRARESEVQKPRPGVRSRHISRAKRRKPEVIPPELAFFALFIKAFDPDAKFDPNAAKFEPIKPTIPYQPNDSWQ